jgi:plastocyanin
MTHLGSTRRKPAFAASLGGLLLVLAACSTTASPSASAAASGSVASASVAASEAAAGPTVTISGTSSFGTDEITVPAGQTLTVTNASTFPHTFTEGEDGVEADNARVNESIAGGESVQVTFPEPGDYNVTCLVHPGMNMVVHVE